MPTRTCCSPGSGHTYQELLDLQAAGQPLPYFPLNATFRATMKVESADLESDNILAVLPGSDPVLREEYVVVSAHLDGYGHRRAVERRPHL